MLSGGELAKLYSKDFAVVIADPSWRNRGEPEVLALKAPPYSPYFIFIDGSGKRVLETRGFTNVMEAKAIHAFVSARQYEKASWAEFWASQKY